jgi:hypothetical protein
MATNLVSLIMQYLTPDMIARIASALGLDRSSAHSAITAAVPALLAGFTGAADTRSGAQNLVEAVRDQSGLLDGISNMIGGSGQSSLIDQGSSLLNSLLGSRDQAALSGAVSKFANIGQGAGNSLLAMLAPVALGVIGKQLGSRNLDVTNLTGLLASQKDQIAQAMPSGFGRLLSGTGLLDSLGGAAGSAADIAGQATRAASGAAGQAAQYASSTAYSASSAGQRAAHSAASAVPSWAYWAIPLVLAAGLIWYFAGRSIEQPVQQATPPAAPAAQSVVVGGVDIGKQLSDSLGTLRTSLQGVTDVASAKAALPRIQSAAAQVDKINDMAGQLSADQRRVIAGLASPATTAVNQLFDKVLAIPGVGDVLRPAADMVKTRLAALSTPSSTVGSGRQ